MNRLRSVNETLSRLSLAILDQVGDAGGERLLHAVEGALCFFDPPVDSCDGVKKRRSDVRGGAVSGPKLSPAWLRGDIFRDDFVEPERLPARFNPCTTEERQAQRGKTQPWLDHAKN